MTTSNPSLTPPCAPAAADALSRPASRRRASAARSRCAIFAWRARPPRGSTTSTADRRSRPPISRSTLPQGAARARVSRTPAGFPRRPRTIPLGSPCRDLIVVDPIDGTRAFRRRRSALDGVDRLRGRRPADRGRRPRAGAGGNLRRLARRRRDAATARRSAPPAGATSHGARSAARARWSPRWPRGGRSRNSRDRAENSLARLSARARRQRFARRARSPPPIRTTGTSPAPISCSSEAGAGLCDAEGRALRYNRRDNAS